MIVYTENHLSKGYFPENKTTSKYIFCPFHQKYNFLIRSQEFTSSSSSLLLSKWISLNIVQRC